MQTSLKTLKNFNQIHRHFEDQIPESFLENLSYDFFFFFTILLNVKNSRNRDISSFDPDVQNSIKRWKRIVQQVSRGRCKEEISIFKIVVTRVAKEIFHCFQRRLNFTERYLYTPYTM